MSHEVRAEMVANVWKVVVAAGDTVEEGDTLVILESMKMEIPVLSEVSGQVAEISGAYDGLAAVRLAVAAGVRVLCVGQHDDRDLRRAALAAGAERVVAYRRLFENGHAVPGNSLSHEAHEARLNRFYHPYH